jgi:hypothetical protein
MVFVDHAFDSAQFADGFFYMPKFVVCIQASPTNAGAALELAGCDGSDAQTFAFSGEGTITHASTPAMFLSLGENTRFDRSQTNQIKTLTSAACADNNAASQIWSYRTAE